MKKIIIILFLTFSFSAIAANNVNPKVNILKAKSFIKLLVFNSCDDDYNAQVSFANDILLLQLAYPPAYANSFYYNFVWESYNTHLSFASGNKKICNYLSAN